MQLKQRNEKTLNEENALARALIVPGVTLYGYCCGYFGRDSYGDKLVLSVIGDALIVREENGSTNTAFIPPNAWVELVNSSNYDLEREDR